MKKTKIITNIIPENKIPDLINLIKNKIKSKQQVYWICPLIEESKKVKFPIFLASSLYRGIGKKIFSSSYNRYFLDRTYLNFMEKIIITFKSFYFFFIVNNGYKN